MKSLTLAAAVAIVASPIVCQSVVLRGKVVDAKGRPVKDADVATKWMSIKGKMFAGDGARTSAAGTWSLTTQTYGKPVAVLAVDTAQARGALTIFAPGGDPGALDLRLMPLQRVTGSVTCTELAAPVEWSNVYLIAMPSGARLAQCSSPAFSFLLPPGQYRFDVYGADMQGTTVDRTVAAEPVELGAVDLEATIVATLYGKEPPPLTISEARGVPAGFDLRSARGKFVILEFWGYW